MMQSDRRAAAWATSAAVILIAQQVASKACRDALFLSLYGAENLPLMMGGAAILSVICVFAVARAFAQRGPALVVPVALTLSGFAFLGEWALFAWTPSWAAISIYLHVATFGAVAISGFWSVITERFDPHAAKASISRISAGAVLGGVAGGLLADRTSAALGLESILPFLAVLSWFSAALIRGVGTPRHREPIEVSHDRPTTPALVTREPYLRNLGAVVILIGMSTTLLDYAFKSEAARAFPDEAALVSFFALFYTVSGIVTFGVQTGLCQRFLQRFGIGFSLALLPLTVLAGGLIGTAWTRLWTVTMVRGAESVMTHSIFRSAYELLYSPVARNIKRPTKTLIDVGCARLGDAVGSAVVFTILILFPAQSIPVSVLAAALASTVALWFIYRLNHGYIAHLMRRLRTGTLRLHDSPRIRRRLQYTPQNPEEQATLLKLSLWLEPTSARVALRAATSGDHALRGCALEFLDQMVPATLRDEVAGLTGSVHRARRATDTTERAIDELLASLKSLQSPTSEVARPSAS